MTVAALAARLGVVPQTAHKWLVAADVPRRASPATARVDVNDADAPPLPARSGWGSRLRTLAASGKARLPTTPRRPRCQLDRLR